MLPTINSFKDVGENSLLYLSWYSLFLLFLIGENPGFFLVSFPFSLKHFPWQFYQKWILSFAVSESVITELSFLKDIISRYRILVWQVFFLSLLERFCFTYLHSYQIMVPLYIRCHFFLVVVPTLSLLSSS